ncbi:polysaccharide deacetylase [Campylobacter geochelonis]|nr:polysaccharide deacetylase [Campylobacter geochelonis]
MPQSYAKARVLMYHSISEHKGEKHDKWRVKPLDFEKQMLWLSQNGFTSYKISELASLEQIPPKSVAITFDDGYEDNFTNSFKVLQKYNLKATIYLVPNQTTNHWESSNTSHISPMLTHLQIKQMQSSGLIEFGSHTLSHENLSTLDDEILKAELLYSKIEISELTNSACTAFAYPYGKFDERIINATKEAGYTNAVVVKRGFYEAKDDKFSIKRIGVLGTESFFDFWLKFTRIRNKL